MKTTFITIGFFAALLAIIYLVQAVNAISEDQFFVCVENYDNDRNKINEIECTIITGDNLLNETQDQQLDLIFNHDLDTFDASYLVESD